jgi:hypothetical protein
MSVKSQQVTKGAKAKGHPARPAVMTRVRGFAGNHTRLKSQSLSRPGDASECEANRMADAVMGADAERSEKDLHRQQKEGATQTINLKSIAPVPPRSARHLGPGFETARSSGEPLPSSVRDFFEPRFGYAFSRVRLHNDANAREMAQTLNARAYTIGADVFMGKGEYAPHTTAGRHLLAHELTHVIQQQSHLQIQRQPIPGSLQLQPQIPPELQTSVDLSKLTDPALQKRYDLVTSTLALFNQSNSETAILELEAGNIGIELSRRAALDAGRTFDEKAIDRMREYFIKNATSASPESCIACMNKGLRLLLDDPKQKMGSEVDKSMAKLGASGRAGQGRVIEFEDNKGRVTKGTLRPEKLHESVWDAVIEMSGGDPGWSVFGMSLLDGDHSVTLTLDNNNPGAPVIYWSDQWSTKGGFKKYDRAGLDAEVTHLTQAWWDKQAEGRKFNTKTTLWRLQQ